VSGCKGQISGSPLYRRAEYSTKKAFCQY
jgi:hypothetical protein